MSVSRYDRQLSLVQHVVVTAAFGNPHLIPTSPSPHPHLSLTSASPQFTLINPHRILTLVLTQWCVLHGAVFITMVAAIAFGSDLQAAMAFSGILVVIMVAIFP